MSELPEGWVKCSLEDCVDVLDSLRVPINNSERQQRIEGKSVDHLYPYYGATGQVGEIDSFLFDEELVALGEDGVPFLDPMKPKAYMLHGKTWVNNHAHVLRGLNGIAANKFVFYYLNQFDYQGFVNGGTRLKLTQASMRAIPVTLPPRTEQTRIVQKLDELLAQVDTLKARIDAIPALLKRFRHSILMAAISGRLAEESNGRSESANQSAKAPLGNLIREMRNGLSAKPNENGKGLPILRISSVRASSVDQVDVRFLECTDTEKNRYSLRAGDLLFTRYNGSLELVGVCGLIRQLSHTNLVYPDKLIRVRCNTDIVLPEYLELFFSAPSTRQQVMELVKSTSGQKGISGQDLKDFVVTYPGLSVQRDIVRRVEQLFAFADQLEDKVASAKSRIDHLTQSILAKAFRGELVPQDPNDEPASVLLERIKAQRAAAPRAKRSRKAST